MKKEKKGKCNMRKQSERRLEEDRSRKEKIGSTKRKK